MKVHITRNCTIWPTFSLLMFLLLPKDLTIIVYSFYFVCSKNAVEMAKSGTGPNVDVVYKAGGKSVEELTGNV